MGAAGARRAAIRWRRSNAACNGSHELADERGRGDVDFRVVYNAADASRDRRARLDALARAGVTDVMVDVDYADPDGPERAIAELQA